VAHNLRSNALGEASFAHADVNPWHGRGINVQTAQNSAEMLKAASLDFKVTKEQLFLADGRKAPAYATMASDTLALLGVVGDRYTPLQNSEAFDFTDSLVKGGEMKYVTAGALGSGERIWILAQAAKDTPIEIIKGDPIDSYLLFSNSHDGSSGVEMRSTSITVVCQNTLAMATRGNAAGMKIRHTASVTDRLKVASGILKAHAEHQKDWVSAMKYLAKHPITDDIVLAFEKAMFGDVDKTPEGRGMTVLTNKLECFEQLLVKGKGTEIPGRCGNLYGMVQAFTEWTDHYSQVKGTDDRTSSIVFANGAKMKAQALEYALVLAKKGA
jgi:phage/plasmid-like protein (TIGR03299 family)